MEVHTESFYRAQEYFEEGYNCCQSVFLVFAKQYGFDRDTACRLAASFGGGFSRLREVCGGVSAMALVCGLECGAVEGSDQEGKAANYAQMQTLAARFETQTGSLICRELLGLDKQADLTQVETKNEAEAEWEETGKDMSEKEISEKNDRSAIQGGMGNYVPQARTETYYASRPCRQLVGIAAEIIECWLEEIHTYERDHTISNRILDEKEVRA